MEIQSTTEGPTNGVVEITYQGPVSVFVVFGGVVVLLIGIPTNLFLLTIIFLRPKLRNLNNFIIANIALCGLIQLLLVIPWQFYSFLTGIWPFAFWYCTCTLLLAMVTVDALMNNMAVLALYRYFVVVRRQNRFLKTKKVIITMVACAWIVAIANSSFTLFGFSEAFFLPQYGRCILVGKTSPWTGFLFKASSAFTFLKVILPILFSYPRIFYEVRKTSLAVASAGTNGTQNGGGGRVGYLPLSRQEVTLTIVCLVNFLLFLSCYGPIVIITFTYIGKGKLVPTNLQKLSTLMYWIGNTLNPLVYAILQKETRDVLTGILRKIKIKGTANNLSNTNSENT